MNRKLLVLNIALAAAVIYAGIELHSEYLAAKVRQAQIPGPAPKPAQVPPVAPLPQKAAVLPSGYKDVAENTLFDPSRNPNLPVPEPPKPAPPPEPPPLPSYHGLMNFGDPQGPVALITRPDAPGHEEIHAGEMIGAFKLVAFDRKEMTLEWEGRTLHKVLGEGGSEQPKGRAGAIEPAFTNGIIPGQANKNAVEPPKPQGAELGPGVEMTDSVKACQAGDSSPAGAINGGYRKEVNVSPMGSQCIWRAVGR